jgi:Rrf2 family protein
MKLSSKTEYGIRALVHLAEHSQGVPYSLQLISEKEQIPYAYLEKIFGILKKKGIVVSQKGPKGGYALARPVEQISCKELCEVLEGDISLFSNLISPEKHALHCKSHLLFALVQNAFSESLHAITLKDLMQHS